MTKPLNVGLIGLGFIGKIHTTAYRNIPLCFSDPPVAARLAAVLRSDLGTEVELMEESRFGLRTTDPEEFFNQSLDIVDICTPNVLHMEQVEQAVQRKLHVYCEKPLAMNYEEARAMAQIAREAGVLTHVAFVLRYLPAIRQMKALLEAGRIGEILNFRGHMYHSGYLDPDRPMSWRLRHSQSGGGVFADLGAHLIDLLHYLMGKVAWVRAATKTYISSRPVSRGATEREEVDVDDWALCTMELESGAMGVLEVTRMAAGAAEETALEIYGSQGALIFHISQPNFVRYYDLNRKMWSLGAIDVPEFPGERPIGQLWPSGKYSQGLMTDAHLASAYDFLLCVAEGKPSTIGFEAGLATQEVLEAAYLSAARGGERIDLP
ncbi:MAG TPA: Gfo/Idh/MocA family oxidoreductase [Anaerolineae bacterium]|nr:Gfo/Idh/MocA family oxidoreductase [Anaerolineae bacterium]